MFEPDPGLRRVRWLFLRGLSLVYLCAFVSLWVQVDGLFGPDGIVPIDQLARTIHQQLGAGAYRLYPSLLWLWPSGGGLQLVCGLGTLAALLALVDLAPVATLALAWLAYLSLVSFGSPFLHFQWDSLLLEAGFLAIFLAPLTLQPRWPKDDPPTPTVIVWLFRWLLFRLMFFSGLVKLLSGDPTWHNLTAMDYHYWTQPLPPWTAYYAAHLPLWWHKLETLGTLMVELAVPFLMLAGRRGRLAACWCFVVLMVAILLTGNYGFFNLLTVALCLLLLDDEQLGGPLAEVTELPRWPRAVTLTAAALVLVLSLSTFVPLGAVGRFFRPFQLVSSYGLFATMTTERPQLVIEGTRDGEHWVPYSFRYQAGPVERRPGWVNPHMPRLDWQVWFAALGPPQQSPWMLRVVAQLLRGSPAVLGLFAENPFPERPPRAVRVVLYNYRFGDENWWTRQRQGLWLPALTADDLRAFPARR